jgi:hypothetical protein
MMSETALNEDVFRKRYTKYIPVTWAHDHYAINGAPRTYCILGTLPSQFTSKQVKRHGIDSQGCEGREGDIIMVRSGD